jgi:hypothetical protein
VAGADARAWVWPPSYTAQRSTAWPWLGSRPGDRLESEESMVTFSPANRTALREEEKRQAPPSQQVIASPVTGPTRTAALRAPWRRPRLREAALALHARVRRSHGCFGQSGAGPMTQVIALMALAALGLSGVPFHEPVHGGPTMPATGPNGSPCCREYRALTPRSAARSSLSRRARTGLSSASLPAVAGLTDAPYGPAGKARRALMRR